MPTSDTAFIRALSAASAAYRSRGFRTPLDAAIPKITGALLHAFQAGERDAAQLTRVGLVVVENWSDEDVSVASAAATNDMQPHDDCAIHRVPEAGEVVGDPRWESNRPFREPAHRY